MEGEALHVFPWAAEGPQVSPAAIEADARLLGTVTSQGALSWEKAVELAPNNWVQSNWQRLQIQPSPYERIQSQSLQVFEVPSIRVSYALGNAPPTVIRFEGRRMLVPPASESPQFEERARKLRFARRVFIVLAVGVPFGYFFRGAFFWSAWVGALTLFVAVAAAAADRFVREWTLGRKDARRWGLLASAAAILAAISAGGAEPSVRSVERHLSAGQLSVAKEELVALGEPSKPAHARAWSAFHLAVALQGSDVSAVAQDAAQLPEGSTERAEANKHLYDITQRTVLQHLEQKNPSAAKMVLANVAPVLQRDTPGTPSTEQLAELNARVHEAEYESCTTDACRWRASLETVQAASSAERAQRLAQARARIVEALAPAPRPKQPSQAWVHRLDEVAALAEAIGDGAGDADLGTRVLQAAEWAKEERRRIPLVGADRAVAAELLRVPPSGDTNTLMRVTSSVALYCAMKEEHCVGVYLVGSDRDARVLNDAAHAAAAAEFLSQALGHPSALPVPPKSAGGKAPTMSTWKDGGVTIVARWSDSNLMELRLGDAKP